MPKRLAKKRSTSCVKKRQLIADLSLKSEAGHNAGTEKGNDRPKKEIKVPLKKKTPRGNSFDRL